MSIMRMSKKVLLGLLLVASGLMAVACGQASTPVPATTGQTSEPALPNLLVQAEGEVWLRRAGWSDFLPVGFGVAVAPGDLLRVAEGSIGVIFCGDETTWEKGPSSLLADGLEHGVPCQTGRPPRPWADVAALRGEKEGKNLYVLRPRNTALLNNRPSLGWHPLPDVDAYTVTLLGDDGQDRAPVQATGGELDWPEGWPPLESGATYVLVIEGDGQRSDEGREGHTGLGFWLLPAEDVESVQALEARLRAQSLSPTAADMLVAELYLGYGLRAEAAQLLRELTASDESPAVQLALGRVYLEMGLATEAQEAFAQALAGAQTTGESEAEAAAQVGLGLAARLLADGTEEEHLQAARALYEQIGDQDSMEQVDQLLAE
ncbi:MAG: hypothetical protein SWK90_11080 [Chloroflexota bacterium]|nr:hypothetical protein [Chloroflexota bacterium]